MRSVMVGTITIVPVQDPAGCHTTPQARYVEFTRTFGPFTHSVTSSSLRCLLHYSLCAHTLKHDALLLWQPDM